MLKPLAAAAALVIAVAAGLAPAQARDSYVIDNAQLLSPATVSAINAKVGDFNAQAHKEVVVVVDPAFTGTATEAEERVFAQQQVNGVLIYIAKSPKTIAVVPDRAAAHYFPAGSTSAIRQAIASAFNSGDFNGGVSNGVDLTLAEYRSHLGSLRSPVHAVNNVPSAAVRSETGGGFNMSLIWWLIALAVIFFVVRGIFRAIAGPRMYPPGYGGGQMGGPMGGYGPGYGGGGFGGGGGSFWSGMLGGLGGAFLGNELFGGGRNEMFGGGQQAGFGGDGGQYGGGDASGFQNDAGQADMGNASSGGWGGDSGGGGWGDTGGGGGDFGGGGGDGGGGW